MREDDEPREMRHEFRVVLKEGSYYIYWVSFYVDNEKEFLLTPTPLSIPKTSVEQFNDCLDKFKEALSKPVVVI